MEASKLDQTRTPVTPCSYKSVYKWNVTPKSKNLSQSQKQIKQKKKITQPKDKTPKLKSKAS